MLVVLRRTHTYDQLNSSSEFLTKLLFQARLFNITSSFELVL